PGRLDEVDFQPIKEVLPRPRPATTLAEEIAEQPAAEDVAEGGHDVLGASEVVHPRAFKAGVAVSIIALTLRLVGKDLVSLRGLLEPLLGLRVAWVLVGVVLQRKLPIRLLDVFGSGVAFDPKYFVIITFRRCHWHGVSTICKLKKDPSSTLYTLSD